ncbi:MAG TPA: hypothetical protein VGV37_06320 [Aliidongia sp.]|uniref:hypothetical protein n=1 Tax=Aliidongia sp. TaxID=1914230 RepID=UPI002DDD1CCC|nr:hypothetical protein [Aliidongia sp.]HEV2674140.1 hypothetical protein [Aliidongia sp.]
MSDLTEREIFACMRENFSGAADDCRRLAAGERFGLYPAFREKMEMIEGCCRQASMWRSDGRFLPVAHQVALAQQKCRQWLVEKHPALRYMALATILDGYAHMCDELETKATGTTGPILLKPLEGEHRTGKPVQVVRPSGLIVPAGVSV